MSLGSWLYEHKGKIGIVATGWSFKKTEEFFFDWLLYPMVVGACVKTFGPIKGTIIGFSIMSAASTIACLAYIKVYDGTKKDWFGFEGIKKLQAKVSWKWASDLLAFIFLSLWEDPFMTTIYLRKGSEEYNGLSKRDWLVFGSSVLLCNGAWTVGWSGVVQVLLFLKQHISL